MTKMTFRGWDVQERCWIPQEELALIAAKRYSTDQRIMTYSDIADHWCRETIEVEIDEYIGKNDRAGQEICEGDYLRMTAKIDNQKITFDAVVVRRPGGFWYQGTDSPFCGNDWHCFGSNDIVIVGNEREGYKQEAA